MLSNEQLLRRYPDLIGPDSDDELVCVVGELDTAAAAARALQPPASLEETIERTIRDHRAERGQRGQSIPTSTPRRSESVGDLPPLQTPGPRSGIHAVRNQRGWLRQWAELAAAIAAFLVVAGVLITIFRDERDDGAMTQAPPEASSTPTPVLATPSPIRTPMLPVGTDLQSVEDALAHTYAGYDLMHLLEQGNGGLPGRIVSVALMPLGEALRHGEWASQDSSRQDDPDNLIWQIEATDIRRPHSCPMGAAPESCYWQHLTYLIDAATGEFVGLRSPDWSLSESASDDPPPVPAGAQLQTVEDAISRVRDLVPGQDGGDALIIGVWLQTPTEAGLGAGWGEAPPVWQLELKDGAQVPAPCSAPPGVEAHCPADHIMLQLHAISGDVLGYRLIGQPVPADPGTPTISDDATLQTAEDAGASAAGWADSILQGHDVQVVRTRLVTVSAALDVQIEAAGSSMQVWDSATYDVPVWVVELEGTSFHRYDCDECPTGTTALLTIRAEDASLYWAAVGSEGALNMTQVIPNLPENIHSATEVTPQEMGQYAVDVARSRDAIESGEPEVLLSMPATVVTLRELGLDGAPYAASCQRPFHVVILRGDFTEDYQYIGYVFDQSSGAPGDVMVQIDSATDDPFWQALGGEPPSTPLFATPEGGLDLSNTGCEDVWVGGGP
ncbi:MAG: hypothetical protein M3439_13645 [Chloroflexota bacterium]|nr:hypothetical protein [Chloroflexota bacterium]